MALRIDRHAARGFTLIELVLALSILAIMITMMFGGLRVGLRAWQRGEAHAEALEHARGVTQLLKQTLDGIYPWHGKTEQLGPLQLLFKGEAERLSFVTVSPPLPFAAPIAFTAVTLSMSADSTPGLAIREKALPSYNPFEEVAPDLVVPSATAIHFSYLRASDGEWVETWDVGQERTLTQAVKVTLTTAVDGRVQEVPSITVQVRVTTP
jgi:general secretion pathway protein J